MKSKIVKLGGNILMLMLAIISVISLLRYSTLPNVFNLECMVRPEVVSDIEVSLCTSFIVTAVFYFFINFLPDISACLEEKEKSFPYRCNMQMDIQKFLDKFLVFWISIYKHAENNFREEKIETISDLFEKQRFLEMAQKMLLADETGLKNGFDEPIKWALLLHNYIKMETEKGEQILRKYSKDLPMEIYQSINYMISSSPLLGAMSYVYGNVYIQKKKETKLSDCIKMEDITEEIDLSQTIHNIKILYDWINKEYNLLTKEVKGEEQTQIHKIDFNEILLKC